MVTRNGNPSGSSSRLLAPLPVRSTDGNHTKLNERNRAHIQKAVDDGKNISGLLADALGTVSLADVEKSNLHSILSFAQELQKYTWHNEFTIGLVGDSGVGKSSLINSLLGVKDLAITVSYYIARAKDVWVLT
jgi:ribosome biogenesis GTPase A